MAPQTIEELLDEFALEVSLKSQPQTAIIYRRDISQLLVNAHVKLTESLVIRENYENLVKELGRSLEGTSKARISTKNRKISAIMNFIMYLKERGEISDLHKIPYYKEPVKEIFPIKRRDFFLLTAHLSAITWDGARDRAMFALGYYVGLTTTEIVGIQYHDFEREGGLKALKVTRTQLQERRLEINQHLARELERYERVYGSVIEELAKQPWLPYFRSRLEDRFEEGITERSLRKILVRTKKEAGLSSDLDWHSLRYGFALDLITQKHATPTELAGLLGISLISAENLYKKLARYSQSDGKREDAENP